MKAFVSAPVPRGPAGRLAVGGVLSVVLAAVADTAGGADDLEGPSGWDILGTTLFLAGICLLIAGGLVILRRRVEREGSRTATTRAVAAVWLLLVIPLIYVGFRDEGGLDGGPCLDDFVEEHFEPGVPATDVRIEAASFPPGATRCVVETPNQTFERVSPDTREAGILLFVAVWPFCFWPFTRQLTRTS